MLQVDAQTLHLSPEYIYISIIVSLRFLHMGMHAGNCLTSAIQDMAPCMILLKSLWLVLLVELS